jgi:hypothetical protein
MAGSLLPDFNNNLQLEGMRQQSQLLQQLGAQVRSDLQTIQTNRQLQGFSQAAQQLNTNSQDFPKEVVGLISQYPMAAQTPIGTAAINQLGAAHKLWAQEQARIQNPYAPIAGTNAILNRQTGQVSQLPEGSRPSKPIQINKNTVGIYDPESGTTLPMSAIGLPEPSFTDPFKMEETKQQNRVELEKLRQAGRTPEEIKQLSTTHSRALDAYMKADAEAKKYETAWKVTGDSSDPKLQQDKWSLGIKATGLRAQAEALKKQVEELSSALKAASTAPAAITPGPDTTSPSAGVDALMGSDAPFIPATPKRGYYKADGTYIPPQ